MANVFTRKSKCPRSIALSDYCDLSDRKRLCLPRILSITRMGNPHPEGLTYQLLKNDQISIWNPNLQKHALKLPKMISHTDKVNFTCGSTKYEARVLGKPPNVKYTESTTSRVCFRDPALFKRLHFKLDTTRYAFTPRTNVARGIVPNLAPPMYRVVQ